MGMRRFITVGFVLAMATSAWAQAPSGDPSPEPSGAVREHLNVAVREAPPFAFKDEEGNWVGITVDLWQAVAKKLGYAYDYKEYDLVGALEAIQDGRADLGGGAFSITILESEAPRSLCRDL